MKKGEQMKSILYRYKRFLVYWISRELNA